MAYCVHCGVQLGESEGRCPLCGTVVLDPAEPRDPSAPRAFPTRTPEQELKRSKRYLLSLAGLMLLLPAVLCFLIDLLLNGGVIWSAYPSGALALLFIAVAVPILAPRHRDYFSVIADFITLNGYLFLVERLSHSGRWFFPIALPALGMGTVMLLALLFLYRHDKLNKVTLLAAALGAVALECLGVELFCSLAYQGLVSLAWSPYAMAPCVFISLALFFINGNRAVREELRRRVHF